jgi:hypothetical protein
MKVGMLPMWDDWGVRQNLTVLQVRRPIYNSYFVFDLTRVASSWITAK